MFKLQEFGGEKSIISYWNWKKEAWGKAPWGGGKMVFKTIREWGSLRQLGRAAGLNHPKVIENRASGGPTVDADTNVNVIGICRQPLCYTFLPAAQGLSSFPMSNYSNILTEVP